MRILYVVTVGEFMPFFKNFIKGLIDAGHEVNIATNDSLSPVPEYYRKWGCKIYNISCTRTPVNVGTIKTIIEISRIIEEHKYDIVHCHTPVAAMCTRFACRKVRKQGVKVVYTAHGFHFYEGAPKKNWIIYCTVEKICSKWTDALITINKEDYKWAKTNLHIKVIEYVPGVGIDYKKYVSTTIDKEKKRKEIGVTSSDFLLLSVGELNDNKNHQIVLRALPELGKNIHYAIAGTGDNKERLLKLAEELDVSRRFHLLGYRNDVHELYKAADAFVLPSIREGLNVSTMEAMASGLPCIVTKIRGNVDMVDENGGYLCDPLSLADFVSAILAVSSESPISASEYNEIKAKAYSVDNINRMMIDIYRKIN